MNEELKNLYNNKIMIIKNNFQKVLIQHQLNGFVLLREMVMETLRNTKPELLREDFHKLKALITI